MNTWLRQSLVALIAAIGLSTGAASHLRAATYDLTVDRVTIDTGDFERNGIGFNGTSPGPVLRFKEGEEVTIDVTNNLDVSSSVHWHGLILPYQMDGVPMISFDGIDPGETFTYQFPIVQSGTYWYHSHTGLQEHAGAYGAIVIEPEGREPFRYDRDYVVQLTDAHPHPPERILRNLKAMPDYYNRQQQTVLDLFRDFGAQGVRATLSERMAWGEMRMMPTDIEDLQGFTALINGKGPDQNWTGLFEPGERVRLRFINSSAMTAFDVRIPGLEMTVVQADGNNVQPVKVDEFRIAVAETYDVIVLPKEDRAYTIFAESMGRSGFARGTLAPRPGMNAEVPKLREPPLLTMADMPMAHGAMDHGAEAGMDHEQTQGTGQPGGAPDSHTMPDGTAMQGMDHGATAGMDHGQMEGTAQSGGAADSHTMPDGTVMQGMDHGATAGMDPGGAAGAMHTMPDGTVMQGAGHSGPTGMDHGAHGRGGQAADDPFYAAGSGLVPVAANGGRFLSYADLKAQKPLYEDRPADREIELRLTGNMERFIWSINDVKYEDAEPIRLRYGERVRFKFVNETMMVHPMHLHGMWQILDVGAGRWNPAKHVVSVAPGTTVYAETEVDAAGEWAFHCHLSYHMESGMFRKVIVEGGPDGSDHPMQHDLRS